MAKEYCRAEIRPRLNIVIKIIMALILIVWVSIFIPVKSHFDAWYEKSYYDNIYGKFIYDSENGYDRGLLMLALIGIGTWLLLCLLIYLCLIRAPKRCSLSLTENGISGVKRTLFGTKSVELPFENITSISVKSGFADTLVSGKTVAIASATGFIRFVAVQNAEDFTQRTMEELRAFKAQVKGQSAAAPSADDGDKLMKLKSLLDSGVLTQEEYEAKKAEILSRL